MAGRGFVDDKLPASCLPCVCIHPSLEVFSQATHASFLFFVFLLLFLDIWNSVGRIHVGKVLYVIHIVKHNLKSQKIKNSYLILSIQTVVLLLENGCDKDGTQDCLGKNVAP